MKLSLAVSTLAFIASSYALVPAVPYTGAIPLPPPPPPVSPYVGAIPPPLHPRPVAVPPYVGGSIPIGYPTGVGIPGGVGFPGGVGVPGGAGLPGGIGFPGGVGGLPGGGAGGLPGGGAGGLPGGAGGFPGGNGPGGAGGFPGDNNNGNGPNGANGSGSGICGLQPGQVSALTPLLKELGLAKTGDSIKQLVDNIVFALGDLLSSDGITQLLGTVDDLVKGLGLGGLDVKPAVDEVVSILRIQVPCLLNTLLPLP